MALKKTKEVDNLGIVGDYWRVTQKNTNYDANDVNTTIQMYISQDGREEGKSPTSNQLSRCFGSRYNDFEVELKDGTKIKMKDLERKVIYEVLQAWAIEENAKEENKDIDVAFFADAVDC